MKRGEKERGAFQLSITTIIIIVIAVVMLILGLTLTKKIMCGAMNIAADSLDAARKQVSTLFQEASGDIFCSGAGTTELILVPGRVGYIGCATTGEAMGQYKLEISPTPDNPIQLSARCGRITESQVREWVYPSSQSLFAGQSPKAFKVEIPKEMIGRIGSGCLISIPITVKQDGEIVDVLYVNLRVTQLSWLKSTIC